MAVPQFLRKRAPWLGAIENRWLRLIFWPIVMLMTTCIYYGWTEMSEWLAEEDWLGPLMCPDWMYENEVEIKSWRQAAIDTGDNSIFQDRWETYFGTGQDRSYDDFSAMKFFCRDQANLVTQGYTLASTAEFVLGFLAGIIFDEVGSFVTATLGAAAFIAGWTMVISSSASKATYLGGMFLMGGSVNLTAFATFLLVDMFPRYPAIVFGLILGAQVTCAGIMPVIKLVAHGTSFAGTMSVFVYAICTPMLVLFLLTMPLTRNDLVREGLIDQSQIITRRERWKSFAKQCITWEFVVFSLWYTIGIMQYNFYTSILWDVTGHWPDVGDIIGWMFLTQGVFAITFGFVNDKIHTLAACCCLTISMNYMWGLLDPDKSALRWGTMLSGLFMVIFNSHFYSTKYCYVEEIFNKHNFGKLAGLIGALAGALQQINTAILDAKPDNMTVVCYYDLSNIISFACLGWLYWRQYVKKVQYKAGFMEIEEIPVMSSFSSKSDSVESDNTI